MPTHLTLDRGELVRIVDEASQGITESTRAKLLTVAATTDAVAVAWFHCDGTQCPARQAGRRNRAFQEAFDRAVAAKFGRDPEGAPFVVRVVGP